ncbi:MAG: Chemotaxis protein cheW [Myxococcaceae bacterium]|nr:Chemotaxis protein cheW [Myxococcaceae bacterium]
MSDERFAERAAEMRRSFDRSFAEPEHTRPEATEALICIRVAGVTYALRLAELAGLFVARRIMPMPSSARALLGLAGIRGAVVPVYGLRELLGHPPSAQPTRWLLLARSAPVGFAFEEFVRYVSVERAHIADADATQTVRAHGREVVSLADVVHPIVSLAHVLETLR